MRILETHTFTYNQFRQIEVLSAILQELDFKTGEPRDTYGDREWLTLNGWPKWKHCDVLVVDEEYNGEFEIYVRRPFASGWKNRTYSEIMFKANEEEKEALVELLLRSEPLKLMSQKEMDVFDMIADDAELKFAEPNDIPSDHLTVLELAKRYNVEPVMMGKVLRSYIKHRKWYGRTS